MQSEFALARLTTAGALDTTFSFDGKLTTDFIGQNDVAQAVAVQSDGKIVAGGSVQDRPSTFGDFALARYTSDGTLDTTFNGTGKTYTDFGEDEVLTGLAIQSNGKIVAAGYTGISYGGGDFALSRYNTNGSLDTTFSGDGKLTTDFTGHADAASAVAIQFDGMIVAAGYSENATQHVFALARYDGDTPAPPTVTPTQALSTATTIPTNTPVQGTPCSIHLAM